MFSPLSSTFFDSGALNFSEIQFQTNFCHKFALRLTRKPGFIRVRSHVNQYTYIQYALFTLREVCLHIKVYAKGIPSGHTRKRA